MQWSPITILTVAGLALLACTPFVMTGVLEVMLALGLASLSTAMLVQFGIVAGNWPLLLTLIAVLTLVYAVLIWRPLRKMMQQPAQNDADSSDWLGLQLTLPPDFNGDSNPYLHYSGVRWKVLPAVMELQLTAGQTVEVVKAQVGEFWVKPVNA